ARNNYRHGRKRIERPALSDQLKHVGKRWHASEEYAPPPVTDIRHQSEGQASSLAGRVLSFDGERSRDFPVSAGPRSNGMQKGVELDQNARLRALLGTGDRHVNPRSPSYVIDFGLLLARFLGLMTLAT